MRSGHRTRSTALTDARPLKAEILLLALAMLTGTVLGAALLVS